MLLFNKRKNKNEREKIKVHWVAWKKQCGEWVWAQIDVQCDRGLKMTLTVLVVKTVSESAFCSLDFYPVCGARYRMVFLLRPLIDLYHRKV